MSLAQSLDRREIEQKSILFIDVPKNKKTKYRNTSKVDTDPLQSHSRALHRTFQTTILRNYKALKKYSTERLSGPPKYSTLEARFFLVETNAF